MWRKEEENGIVYFSLPAWEEQGAKVVFSCRGGGVSGGPYESLNLGFHVGDDPAAVTENRRRVLSLFAVGPGALVAAKQTHTKRIRFVTAAAGGAAPLTRKAPFRIPTVFSRRRRGFCSPPSMPIACPSSPLIRTAAFWVWPIPAGGAHWPILAAHWSRPWRRRGEGRRSVGRHRRRHRPRCYRVDERFYAAFTRRYAAAAPGFVKRRKVISSTMAWPSKPGCWRRVCGKSGSARSLSAPPAGNGRGCSFPTGAPAASPAAKGFSPH